MSQTAAHQWSPVYRRARASSAQARVGMVVDVEGSTSANADIRPGTASPGRVVASSLGAPDRVLLFLDELQPGQH